MDESRFTSKGGAASRMMEERRQYDTIDNKYNADWKVTREQKEQAGGSMMSNNKYGGP